MEGAFVIIYIWGERHICEGETFGNPLKNERASRMRLNTDRAADIQELNVIFASRDYKI